jgi:hypothetical protein
MRKWLRLFSAVALVCLLGLYPLLAPPAHRIDRAHADLIVQGMTKEQVEAISGVPPGEYDWAEEAPPTRVRVFMGRLRSFHESKYAIKRADGVDISHLVHSIHDSPRTILTWTSRHGSFMVWFDHNELVHSANSWTEVRIVPPWQRWWNRCWTK